MKLFTEFAGLPADHIRKKIEPYVEILLQDELFQNCLTFRQQCGRLNELFRNQKELPVPYSVLSLIFEDMPNKSAIARQIEKLSRPVLPPGRPSSLSKEEMAQLHLTFQNLFENRIYPTYEELAELIEEKFKKFVGHDVIYRFLKMDGEFYQCRYAIPIDEKRCYVPDEAIKSFLHQLIEKLVGVQRGFLFNIDESGQQDFVDAMKTIVICPADADEVYIPASRASRKLTVLHTICSDGDWVKPLFVVSRKTIDSELYRQIPPKSIAIQYQGKGHLDSQIFSYWLYDIFIPYLMEKRSRESYTGPSLLLLDGFSSHKSVLDKIPQEIQEKLNLRILFIPPHTSDRFQPLDLVIFAAQKRYMQKLRKEKNPDFSNQTNQIIAVYRSLQKASDIGNVVSSFEAAGICATSVPLNSSPNTYCQQFHVFVPEKVSRARVDLIKMLGNLEDLDESSQRWHLLSRSDGNHRVHLTDQQIQRARRYCLEVMHLKSQ